MAISIDYTNYIVTIPKADMLLVQTNPIEVRQLNLYDLHVWLRDFEDDALGMPMPGTHNYIAPVSVGGVDLAYVLEILAPWTITFENGAYAVNLVGGNSNVADRVNINTVGVRSANSAGLPDLSALQATSFQGAVSVSAASSYSGTTYPVGTSGYPVNNIPDAKLIAAKYFLDKIRFIGNYTLDTGDDVSYFKLEGQNAILTTVTINAGAETIGCEIKHATVTGNLDGGTLLEYCVIDNLNYINGFVHKCMLNPGTITLGGSAVAHFMDCYSGVPGVNTPTIDMNGAGAEDTPLAMRSYNGGIKLIQKTGTAACSIDLASGQVIIDSSCTAGSIVVRGDGKVVDENGAHMASGTYNGALTVLNEAAHGPIADMVWGADIADHITAGTFGQQALTTGRFLGLK